MGNSLLALIALVSFGLMLRVFPDPAPGAIFGAVFGWCAGRLTVRMIAAREQRR